MNRIKTAPPWMRISQRTYVTECALGSIKLKNYIRHCKWAEPTLDRIQQLYSTTQFQLPQGENGKT